MKTIIISVAIGLAITDSGKNIEEPSGKEIFEKNCAKCHGKDGTKRLLGAKNLQKSILTTTENYEIIANGKGKMPSWKEKLSTEQINQVIEYLDILKQKNKE
jgi:cytochrome c6